MFTNLQEYVKTFKTKKQNKLTVTIIKSFVCASKYFFRVFYDDTLIKIYRVLEIS